MPPGQEGTVIDSALTGEMVLTQIHTHMLIQETVHFYCMAADTPLELTMFELLDRICKLMDPTMQLVVGTRATFSACMAEVAFTGRTMLGGGT